MSVRKPQPIRSPARDATKLREVATRMRFHESLLELIPIVLRVPNSFLDLKAASCNAQTIATAMLTNTSAEISKMFSWLRPTVLLKKLDDTLGDASMLSRPRPVR